MSPEEKAVRMMLLDKSEIEQEFYRHYMERLLTQFKETYRSFDNSSKDLWLCSLSIAMLKFAEYVEDNK
jgi:hypothetical protein